MVARQPHGQPLTYHFPLRPPAAQRQYRSFKCGWRARGRCRLYAKGRRRHVFCMATAAVSAKKNASIDEVVPRVRRRWLLAARGEERPVELVSGMRQI